MTVFDILTELQEKAFHDEKIRQELLETRQAEEPLFAFCKKCQELGYELYPMELVNAGEMKRSTNGGGENSPKLEGEDDLYELFFAAIEEKE